MSENKTESKGTQMVNNWKANKLKDEDIIMILDNFISRIEKEAREEERKKFRESLNSFTYEPQNKNDKGNNVLKTLQAIFNEKTYG